MYLEIKGFEVDDFRSFNMAVESLKLKTPDLIISDFLNDNDPYNGVDFYIKHVMGKNIPFALISGILVAGSPAESMKTFLKNISSDYKIFFEKEKQVILNVKDSIKNKTYKFPCFTKPFDIKDILDYFSL